MVDRVWVAQELTLSVDPWVQIANTKMRWGWFCSLLRDIDSHVQGPELSLLVARMRNMDSLRCASTANGYKLFDILQKRKGLGVKDARDMIYAHLGIVGLSSTKSALLAVDYIKSISEVYTDAALYMMKSSGLFSVLSLIERVDTFDHLYDLPSWVPNWTSSGFLSDLGVTAERASGVYHTIPELKSVLGCAVYPLGTIEVVREDTPPVSDLPELRGTAEWKNITSQDMQDDWRRGENENVEVEWRSVTLVLQQQLKIWLGDEFYPIPKFFHEQPFQYWDRPYNLYDKGVDRFPTSLESLFEKASKYGAHKLLHPRDLL